MTETSCPHCGEPVEPRQLVCLNCGGRVALKERTPIAREPVTAVAAALVATIVIGAGLFGFAISELTSGDGDDPAPREERASAPAAEEEPAADEEPAAEAPAVVGGEDQPARTAPAESAPAGPDRVPGWPRGLTAHTVVLVTSSDRAAAMNVAEEARSSGLEAGLMRSDPYDLGSGLWIVYTGHFTTPEGAGRQASELAGRYPGAYPQLVQSPQ